MPKSTDKMFFRWNGTRWVLKTGETTRYPLSEERKAVKRLLTPAVRSSIARDAGYVCTYCKRAGSIVDGPDGSRWELDHIVPVSRGGSLGRDNVALSCRACNQAKGRLTPEEWTA